MLTYWRSLYSIITSYLIIIVCSVASSMVSAQQKSSQTSENLDTAELASSDFLNLSFEQLLQVKIITASRSADSVSEAPAVVIVLTQSELYRRGYRDLSEIFDDLPGMDISRPYGDVYFNNTWRGLRQSINQPYLLMLDGIVFNDLYYNTTEIFASMPFSNIKQIEIMYGPASVLYGPNAFVGVINIISQKSKKQGSSFVGQASRGSLARKTVDGNYQFLDKDFWMSATFRVDEGLLDKSTNNIYEWTRDNYYADQRLWGGFLQDPSLAGGYGSRHKQTAFELRLSYQSWELQFQDFLLQSGYGNEYPADLAQNDALWKEPMSSALIKYHYQSDQHWQNTSYFRSRLDGIDADSYFVEGYNVFDSSVNRRVRVVDYSLYEVNNYSKTLGHDVSYQPNEQWNFQAGLQREKRDLQKAAKVVFGPSLQPEEFELADYIFPQLPSNDPTPDNRIKVINDSLYLLSKYQTQGWWSWLEQQSLHLGIRVDKHSEQGSIITKRGGLVGQKNQWTFKLLYGESFQEPPPRVLYGGWTGSGSDPEVKPETASTLEFSIGQQNESSSFLFSVYAIETQDTIAAIAGGATNTNSRKVLGEDIHYKVLMPVDSLNEWYLWGYFSHLDAKEKQSNKELNIGDSSPYKLWLGSNITINDYWRSSIRARYFSNKKTIASNPVDKVPAYWTADLTVDYLIPSSHNLTLSFSINNLFDKHYTHAGVRTADAGQNAGYFDEDGVFQGASGFFSSLLPQEGRTVQISLLFSL